MSKYAIKYLIKDDEGNLCAPSQRHFKYEIGKLYSKNVKKNKKAIRCCGNGFHAPIDRVGIKSWYNTYYNVKCFLVEISGICCYDPYENKISCENIKIIEEIPLGNIHDKGYNINMTIDEFLENKGITLISGSEYYYFKRHGSECRIID